MNCTQVEKLIPLHVGNDLPTVQAVLVSTHLEHCASCQTLAAEFAASRDWLGAFTMPMFDEAVFNEMRAAVRQQIAQTERQPAPLTLLTMWWRPRFAMAMAALLLLAGLSFYAYRQQRATVKETPVARIKAKQTRPEATPESTPRDVELTNTAVNAQPSARYRSPRRSGDTKKPRAAELPTQNLAIMTNKAKGKLKETANQLAAREMTRIEWQTADPNIRIIWFAPRADLALTSQRN